MLKLQLKIDTRRLAEIRAILATLHSIDVLLPEGVLELHRFNDIYCRREFQEQSYRYAAEGSA